MVHDKRDNHEGRGVAHVPFVPGNRLHDLCDPPFKAPLA
jgi:hypothetical protein